jgi:hypothetical protein
MNEIIIDTLGNIIKEELLISLEDKIIPNTLVLENRDSFPGYYHLIPDQAPPHSIFIITRIHYSREEITRIAQTIRHQLTHSLDASSGIINVKHEEYFCIRLLSLEAYSHILEIQKAFSDNGILLKKFEKIHSTGLIKVKKFFTFKVLEPNFYLDNKQDFTGFFRIPEQLSWNLFEEITKKVKNNWVGNDFDAALASAYINHEIHDLVRIYSRELNLEMMKIISDQYNYQLSRI